MTTTHSFSIHFLQSAFHSTVDVAAVRYDHDRDDPCVIINAIDHAIVTDTNAVIAWVAFDRLDSGRVGIRDKGFYAVKDMRLRLT